MPVYTVHEPPHKRDGQRCEPERFAFVRDGFSFWAFLFGPLWMLRHRMWLAFFCLIVVMTALDVAFRRFDLSGDVGVTVVFLLALLIGFEAGTLRRFTLSRRKWTNVGVIVADDLDAAERRFFDAWTRSEIYGSGTADRTASSLVRAPSFARAPAEPDVVGLFPQSGAPR